MRFKRHLEPEYGFKQIFIVPLINTVFLLLIFFILASNFLVLPGIRINLPKVFTSDAVGFESIELFISGENDVYLNGRVVKTEELKTALALAASRGQSVLIKADRRTPLSRAVETWNLCRDLGISQVNIITDQQ